MAAMRNFSSCEEMNEKIISSFNSVVSEKDITYFIGDFCFKSIPNDFLDKLNGHFYFIRGNHDPKLIKHRKIVHWVNGYYDIKIQEQKITLCHYPMLSWNCSHYNSILLFGHHHSSIITEKFPFLGRSFCVSVEALTYQGLSFGVPISFDQVMEIVKDKNNWDLITRSNE